MNIPNRVPAQANDKHPIKRGAIIKEEYQFPDNSCRFKYFVVLNKDPQISPLLCVITTSQIDFYLKNPQFNNDALTIAQNKVPCFTKDTVVDCRQIHELQRNFLSEAIVKGVFAYFGEMPQYLMEKIDDIVKASKLISKT